MMKQRLSIVVGSLVGAAVVYVAMACGTSGGSGSGGISDASAQTPASACQNWQVSFFAAPDALGGGTSSSLSKAGLYGAVAIPTGWEPMGATQWPFYMDSSGSPTSYGALVSVRHCAD